jgi:dissimilatory sulfite reductase (desulfoviridin) alpha/beta subunit
LSFGGLFGNRIAVGRRLEEALPDMASVLAASDAALDFFVKYGRTKERFRNAIDRIGWDVFQKEIGKPVQP